MQFQPCWHLLIRVSCFLRSVSYADKFKKVRKLVFRFFRYANELIYSNKSHDGGIVSNIHFQKALSHHDLLGKHPCLKIIVNKTGQQSESRWTNQAITLSTLVLITPILISQHSLYFKERKEVCIKHTHTHTINI